VTHVRESWAAIHGRLWFDDPIYRSAWLIGPALLALLAFDALFWTGAGPASAPWGKSGGGDGPNLFQLRDKATTDRDAFTQLEQAARSGDPEANFFIGTLYDPFLRLSKITQPDVDRSIAHYNVSANGEGGNTSAARNNLASFHFQSESGRQDYAKACAWAAKAGATASPYVLEQLGYCHVRGLGGFAVNTPAGVAAFEAASRKGGARATATLGYYYEVGEGGLARNPDTAVRLYREAADKGDGLGLFNLSGAYNTGIGPLKRDPQEASRLMLRALETGYGYAAQMLASRPQNWKPDFWIELQRQLAARRAYDGPLDGAPNAATLAAVKRLAGVK
jgi:TPR repeat protein